MALKLIVTSTRDSRVGDAIAQRIAPAIAEGAGREVEVLDLVDVNLPLSLEPQMPSLGNYQHATTKAWAETVASADGFVFLTPEYNGFFTAAAKNAVDTVYAEWGGKPAAIVGYGFAGANRAVPMLAQLLTNVNLEVAESSVQMPFGEALGEEGLDIDALVAPHIDALRALGAQLA
ncbi:NADPH-dependent FMN reductase [uncultured Tessaracoccus sp.]|uniref:NADPH-dependent FMN reductase n=1 Tax=uncultured Tessaracoccus sp. TaxID=905023 RepID=UPI002617661A|nr:NAD(P)H-dependent oxidoreductase [uncultured Tessaracoccus sp.]